MRQSSLFKISIIFLIKILNLYLLNDLIYVLILTSLSQAEIWILC